MTRRARRLVVVTSRYPFGSQEAYLNTELEELKRYFERIVVVPVRPPASTARHRVPAQVETLSWPLFSLGLLWRAARALWREPAAALESFRTVAASHDPGRMKNCVVALKALALGDWVIENGMDHIHAYWLSTPASVAMIAAKMAGVAWSSTAHRWDIYERNAFDAKEKSVSFVRTISSRGASDLARSMPSLNGRIIELRLGTLVPKAPVFRREREPFCVICPAALVAVKGHDDLLRAIATLRNSNVPIRCTLAGNGPLRRDLELTAARLGLDDLITFAGFIPQARLHEWYRAGRFAAVVLSSRAASDREMEGVPSALIEAMAFGVPVVATDSGSIGELLDAGVGRLVKAGDCGALAAALFDVYLDPRAAESRARRAYERVAAQHDASTQMQKLAAALTREG